MCSSKHKFNTTEIMVCKEDVVVWFRDLESYKRIDTMCTLLNMCLPFELRFLGTVLEELGRRDAQEFRGVELRVNNQQEFVNDIQICHNGDPNDTKVRRKMALYLALLRATFNRTCINELFTTLEQWGDGDFSNFADGDALQELLLVYTMATNHPIFTFEQRGKCGNVLHKIKLAKHIDLPSPTNTTIEPQQHVLLQHQQSQLAAIQISQIASTPSTNAGPYGGLVGPGQYLTQQHNSTSTSTPPPQIYQMMQPNPGYTQTPMTQIIPDNIGPHMTTVDVTQLQMTAGQGAPNVIPIPQDFSIPPPIGPWGLRPQHGFVNQQFQSIPLEGSFHQSTSSPMLSQPSSPAHSRTTSPNRVSSMRGEIRGNNSNTGGDDGSSRSSTTARSDNSDARTGGTGRNNQHGSAGGQRGSLRNSRRPSIDSTPPPQQQSQHSQLIQIVGNEVIIPQNLKADFNEVLSDTALSQLQQLQLRNGYTRPMMPLSRQSNKNLSYLQHNQQQSPITGLPYNFQNMEASTGVLHHKSGGSDSGSASGGEISPPETPSNAVGNTSTSNMRDDTRREMGNNNNNRRGLRGLNGRQQQQGQQQLSSKSHQDQQQGSVIYATTPLAGQFPVTVAAVTGGAGDQTQLLGAAVSSNSNLISSNSQNNLQQLSMNAGPSPTFVSPAVSYQLAAAAAAANRSMPPQLLYIQQPFPQFIQSPVPQQQQQTANMRSSPSLQIPPTQSPQQQQSTTILTNSSAFPTNKMNQSCFNCGSTSHSGRECQESSMEDVTRTSIYKLDYNSSSNTPTAMPNPMISLATTSQQQPEIIQTSSNSSSSTSLSTVANSQIRDSQQQQQTITKIKPHFNADIVPQNTIDQDEIIDLISDSSSNGSRK